MGIDLCVRFLRVQSWFYFSSSRLPDGLTRRGDVNLLMLGDPGTAKSQLLKFVERCSPIGVRMELCFLFSLSHRLLIKHI